MFCLFCFVTVWCVVDNVWYIIGSSRLPFSDSVVIVKAQILKNPNSVCCLTRKIHPGVSWMVDHWLVDTVNSRLTSIHFTHLLCSRLYGFIVSWYFISFLCNQRRVEWVYFTAESSPVLFWLLIVHSWFTFPKDRSLCETKQLCERLTESLKTSILRKVASAEWNGLINLLLQTWYSYFIIGLAFHFFASWSFGGLRNEVSF